MRRIGRHAGAGFTLVEMLISLTLLAVVMGAIVETIITTRRDYVRQRESARAQDAMRTAQVFLSTVLRTAGADPRNTGLTGLDPNPLDHGTFDNLRVVSDFNPADGDVADPLEDVLVSLAEDTLYVRGQAGGTTEPLAFPVREIEFSYYGWNGALLASEAQIGDARRARIVLAAPTDPRTDTLKRMESWVFLRNSQ